MAVAHCIELALELPERVYFVVCWAFLRVFGSDGYKELFHRGFDSDLCLGFLLETFCAYILEFEELYSKTSCALLPHLRASLEEMQ